MEERKFKPTDRSRWGRGPWDEEPDREEWRSYGFPCLVRRGGSGSWCGYVAVPPGHPWHGKGYSELYDEDRAPDVHGGLTFAGPCSGEICHVPAPGEPDDMWWHGFDCAHSGDISPLFSDRYPSLGPYDTYKDIGYAKRQTERLAKQAAAVLLERTKT